MKIFYDTEFVDDGETIELVSIGMVAEDGREYYAVSNDFATSKKSLKKFAENEFLMEHVFRGLPQVHGDARHLALSCAEGGFKATVLRRKPEQWRYLKYLLAIGDPVFKSLDTIAHQVMWFISDTPDVELWAYYSAYDHVAYAQLFGKMVDLPEVCPMFTNDLKQECNRLGNPRLPQQEKGKHNALEDARHNQTIAWFLKSLEREQLRG